MDKLAHAVKNIDKIISKYEEDEDGYSGRYMPTYAYENRRSYRDGGSYAARRRDSRGRYSRDGMADKLRELMEDAPDEKTKAEVRKLAEKIEQM